MSPIVLIFAFWIYFILVYLVKRLLYRFDNEPVSRPLTPWRAGNEHALIFSPDYWWAFRFKSRIADTTQPEERADLLKAYVKRNNSINLGLSLVLGALCLISSTLVPASSAYALLSSVALIRFLSRSYEIAYAFGCDVLQPRPTSTRLTKYERVRLALVSYLEIYAYSAAAYTVLPTVSGALDAITLALNVGTLTNVGYAFSKPDAPFVVNLVFVQVFTTLSLVVLSLAAYLSRTEET